VEHKRCKCFFPKVHKGKKHFAAGIATHVSCEQILHNLNVPPPKQCKIDPNQEDIGRNRPGDHYHMSDETRHPLKINRFLDDHADDPAVKVRSYFIKFKQFSHHLIQDFLPQLKDHLLGRIYGHDYNLRRLRSI